jgi:arsenical pump membrane protein
MTFGLQAAITLATFAATIVLVLLKPKRWHEALWTCLGAGVVLALGFVGPGEAVSAVFAGGDALIFLLALLLLTALVEQSGFFEWAAVRSAQLANGNGHALFLNVFILGALITIVLSLDTTAVILTPIVLAFVQRLKLPARPFVFACAFVANTASLLLPISNLTNLLYVGHFHQPFAVYAARMFFPQLVAVAMLYLVFRWLFRRELVDRFDPSSLGDSHQAVRSRAYFHVTCVVLALVFIGYFVGPAFGIPAWAVAFAASAVLMIVGVGREGIGWGWLRHVPFGLFPFVAGLFILVRSVENLHLVDSASQWLQSHATNTWSSLFASMTGAAVASNTINNLPAALLVRGLLEHGHAGGPAIYGALLGTNIGPNITIFGSLATMLVVASARRRGVEVSAGELLTIGLIATPIVLLASAITLGITFELVPVR